MTKRKVRVQSDRAVRVDYGGANISRPQARLGKNIMCLRIFTIERNGLKSAAACLLHQRRQILDRAVIPLHDQRAGKPQVSLRNIGIERQSTLEQIDRRHAISPACLVDMPETALAKIPRPHVLWSLCDDPLTFGE